MKNEIKAILFDFMGVLLFEKDNYPPDRIVDEIDQIIGGVTNDSSFKNETLEHYKLNEKEFKEVLSNVVDKYEKFQSLWKLLPDLRKNYKLAIINNGTALTLQEFDTRHLVKENFDLFVSSAIEGIRKPDSEIFLLTARKLGVKPDECLFMDDSKLNTEGAEETGMKSIWWEDKQSGFDSFLKFLKNEEFAAKKQNQL